jgi:predicted permease
VFSVVHAVILSALPYPDSDRVERVGWLWNDRSPATGALSPFKFAYLREHSTTFEAVATWRSQIVESPAGAPLHVLRVSDDFLDVVGTRPALGREFRPDEHDAAAQAALLTDRLWRARFAADPGVLGRDIVLGDRSVTIVGVLPPSFEFAELRDPVDVLVPLGLRPDPSDLGANFAVMGRLTRGILRDAAQSDLDRVFAQLRRERPEQFSGPGERAVLMSFQEIHLAEVTRPLWTLFAGVLLVLLIACTNVANLLLARGTTRLREMAVRGALGASRGRLLRQGVAEGLVIAAIGGVAGVILGAVGLRSLISLAPGGIARLEHVGIDAAVLGFIVAVTAVTGAVFGLAATGIGTLPQAGTAAAFTARGASVTRTGRRVRQLMIGLESGLAMLLVVGAVLLVSGFHRLTQTPLGFDPEAIVAVTFTRLPSEFNSPARAFETTRAVRDALAAVPGVVAAAAASVAPLGERGHNMPMTIDGRPEATEGAVEWRVVSREYAEVMNLRLLQGRWFSDDEVAMKRPVAVVTKSFAARYFPDGAAIGERLWVAVFRGERRRGATDVAREIVGVVDDIRDLGPTRPIRRTVFLPQAGDGGVPAFLVRTAGLATVDSLRAAVRAADPSLPDPIVSTMTARLGSRLARDRFSSLLMTAFAAVALFLTVVGDYGVVAWVVRHAAHEIGIRIALGASRPRVLRGVLAHGLRPVVAGLVAGGGAALMASGLFDGLVVGATSVSFSVVAGAAAVLVSAAAIAAWVPARRALSVDPAAALRAD